MNVNGTRALDLAIERGHVLTVKVLSQSGAVKVRDFDRGKTPLMKAAEHKQPGVVATLLDLGADVSALENKQWSPLHYAIQNGSLEVTALLMPAPFWKMMYIGRENFTNLDAHAASFAQIDMLEFLRARGMNFTGGAVKAAAGLGRLNVVTWLNNGVADTLDTVKIGALAAAVNNKHAFTA